MEKANVSYCIVVLNVVKYFFLHEQSLERGKSSKSKHHTYIIAKFFVKNFIVWSKLTWVIDKHVKICLMFL